MIPAEAKQRFLSRIKYAAPDLCWEWTSGKFPTGYGAMSINSKMHYAHRLAVKVFKNLDPTNMVVCHSCDNPSCVNPDHLFLGTQQDNVKDRDKKGRCQKGETHYNAKLAEKQVLEIRKKYAENNTSYEALGKEYGVSHGAILKVVKFRTFKHLKG